MDIGYGDRTRGGRDFAAGLLEEAGSVEEKLEAALRLLAAASRHFELSADPAFLADESLRILDCNPAFLRFAGGAFAPGSGLEALYRREDGPSFVAELRSCLGRTGFWEGEAPLRGSGGSPERLTLASVRQPSAAAYVGIVRDISELRRAEARLAYNENHDALTGLPNRQQYLAALDALLASGRGRADSRRCEERAAEPSPRVAACVLDLDEFKRFNNDATREVGDDLLRAVAGRLSEAVRQADILARSGGDEFSLCFSLERGGEAPEIAQRVLAVFASPFRVRGRLYHLRASMGIAVGPEHGADAASLAASADLALQARKAGGKTGYEVYRKDLEERLVGAAVLEGELRQAMSAGAIEVHYQPVVRVADLRVSSVEALARWRRDGGFPVPPSRFIPVAEETGLIFELGDRVLDEACAWRSRLGSGPESGPRVCVNVSARQLLEPGFAERAASRIAAAGLSPRAVTVEITESVLLGDLEAAARVAAEIRRTGARVLVDDFGTGFASLAYLKSLPVDGVKIDRSFVADIVTNPQSRGIVEAVVFLARELGIETIAEGVETRDQFDAIRETGCDYAQGYLFGKAMPAGEIEAVVAGGLAERLG